MSWLFRVFSILKDQVSVNKEKSHEVPEGEERNPKLALDGKRQEMGNNCSLIGSVAKTMEGRNSTYRRKSTLYIIGDYLYVKDGVNCEENGRQILLLTCNSSARQCVGRAHIDQQTLKVLKFPLTHSCTRDPNLKYQLEMENYIENLAETTKDNSRDIFNNVCLKYPSVATRITFFRVRNLVHKRRKLRDWKGNWTER